MKKINIILIFFLIILIASCGKKEQEYVDQPDRQSSEKNTIGESTQNEKKDTLKDQTQQQDKTNNTEKRTNYEPAPEKIISPLEANDYVGKVVTIQGYVADVYKTEAVAYLNFVEKYPNNPVAGVIFKKNFNEIGDISLYAEKNVSLTGRIMTYKGKPEIIIDNKSQIKIIK